jgi:carotenoid 1,2-hydratase
MHAGDASPVGGIGAGARFAGAGHAAPHAGGLRGLEPGDGWSPLWTGLARVGGILPAPGQPDADPWALLRGRQHPSRRGRADGGAQRPSGRRMLAQGPRFDVVVGPQGYAWWYVDAFSDDRRHGLTIIAFIGSVFSPYYKLSGRGDPDNHCAINVALNGPRSSAWAMTERGRRDVGRDTDRFEVGPSAVRWDGDCLVIDIRERSMPLGYKVAGQVRVTPRMIGTTAFALDPDAIHRWHPVAPRARVEVAMTHPGVRWSGEGYFDSNFGDEPLEAGFVDWHWSRAHLKDEVAVLYGGERRDGRPFNLALSCDSQGRWRDRDLPPVARLRRSNWLVERLTRADAGHRPSIARTWIDAPFYARSALDTRLWGEDARAVHESLNLRRFASPVVQSMLPYRMPRALF